MTRILAAIDLGAQATTALRLAQAVAGPTSSIRIVHAARQETATPSPRDAALSLLREHAATLPGAEHKLLGGPPARAILDEARDWRADLIVVAPKARSPVERLLMGSVSSEILRDADANVLVARPTAAPLRRLLVCTDLHAPSQRAAAVAARLAQQAGAATTLLFAADPAFWGPDATAPWPPEAYDIDADWLDRAHQEALHQWLRTKVKEFNAKHFGGQATPIVRDGSPREVILDEARRHDLVVVGTHGPNLYQRATIGSVAAQVAARAETSVLVVKR